MNTIITGASSNHYNILKKMLRSVRQFHSKDQVELVIWDLGLTEEERKSLETEFNTVVRIFDYSKYPSYYNIQVAAGEYAWKPALIKETRQSLGQRTYLWLDASDRILQPLEKLFLFLEARGIFSNATSGLVSKWNHPKMFEALDPRFRDYLPLQMRNGALIGFNERLDWVRKMMDTYAEWANTKTIIAPEGSSRENHRQDQSCLTLLYWDYNRKHKFHTDIPLYSIVIHSEIYPQLN
jgi:Protein of unknown function (DUF1647)